jgi:hypothetical protein
MAKKFAAGRHQANEIKIKDFDDVQVEGMLRFVYCGEVDNLDGIAARLLPIARAYGLRRLEVRTIDSH